MLRGIIVPRIPWGIAPEPIKGLPGAPYLLPIDLSPIDADLDAVTVCWGTCMAHVWALHTLYLNAGHSRVTERLLEMAREMASVLGSRGSYAAPAFLSRATAAATAAFEERGPMIAMAEAGWWAVAAQASFALSAWYGLLAESDEDAAAAAKLHRSIRAGLICMFGDGAAGRLLDQATGDGAGDLLKLVAQVHVALEVKP